MNFEDLYTHLADDTNQDVADSTILTRLKRSINSALRDYYSKYSWFWREKEGVFQNTAVYSGGTVTVTQSSTTVSGDSTAFTASMVGRYFKTDGSEEIYKIVAVASGTSLTIDVPYAYKSDSGCKYRIYQRYYYLPPAVDELIELKLDNNVNKLFLDNSSDPMQGWNYGTPSKYRKFILNPAITTYTTGTISGTINTRTITGAGTLFLANAQPGDEITIGSYTYNVLSVDTDTQLTISQNQLITSSASTSYTIKRKNVVGLEFNSNPETYVNNIRYKYLQNYYDMQNDNDVPEAPEEHLLVALEKAKSLEFAGLDDPRESESLSKYNVLIGQKEREANANRPKTGMFRWQGN